MPKSSGRTPGYWQAAIALDDGTAGCACYLLLGADEPSSLTPVLAVSLSQVSRQSDYHRCLVDFVQSSNWYCRPGFSAPLSVEVRVLSRANASHDRVTAEVILTQPFEKFFGLYPTPMDQTSID